MMSSEPSLLRPVHRLAAPERSNCIVWARWRFLTRGGYYAVRRSFFSPFIVHAFWSRNMKIWWGWQALSSVREGHWWEALWFRGHVVMGDADAIAKHAAVVAARASHG
jgi:hypothetical protein